MFAVARTAKPEEQAPTRNALVTVATSAALILARGDRAPFASRESLRAAGDGGPLVYEQTALDFGDVQVGGTSRPDTVNVINGGGTPVRMSLVGGAPDAPFGGAQNCGGTTLGPGQACHMFFTFRPADVGAVLGTARGSWNGQDFAIALRGTGVAPRLVVSPAALDFGEVQIGRSSATDTVTITNAGTAPVAMRATGGAPEGPFRGAQDCQGTTLEPGHTCHLFFTFSPTTPGAAAATSSGSWSGVEFRVALSGTGIPAGAAPSALFVYRERALAFGDVQVGSASRPDTVDVVNVGGAPVAMGGEGGAPPGPFRGAQDCLGRTVDPGAACHMVFTFRPDSAGAAAAESAGNWNGQAYRIALSGTGVAPSLTISPVGVDFGAVRVGGTSKTDTVDVTNAGLAPLVMRGRGGAPWGDFHGTQDCGGRTLAPGETCHMYFTFAPTTAGPAATTATGSWSGVDFTIALRGTGAAAGPGPGPGGAGPAGPR